ncbi:hypothetical protein ACFONG_02075 [Uliginosibacterium paludis]|jgi:hypothetical protein|uniref:Uncharacterized protein n=1 Tax=Uliginosibacterium paludis TaxID=1615952 RepID=A0ABV2CTZ9_9RHOO
MNHTDMSAERPPVFGDFGQDDAFATESHPEGLRYAEAAHPPGCLGHPLTDSAPLPPQGEISIG